jgi:hypothetical protein
MRLSQLVISQRGDHQRLKRLDPSTEEAEHIERRLVRPVQILDCEHRRAFPQLGL